MDHALPSSRTGYPPTMITLALRHRYLTAMGLSSCLVTACSSNEGGPPVAPASTEDLPASALPRSPETPTSAMTPTAAVTTAVTASPTTTATPTALPAPTTREWEPRVAAPAQPILEPQNPLVVPTGGCPEGELCVTAANAKGSPKAKAPFQKCAESLEPPGQRSSGQRVTSFDAAQTARERSVPSTSDACCYDWVVPCPGGRPLLVDGVARTAEVIASSDWACAAPEEARAFRAPVDCSIAERSMLARHYTVEASYEHASVASFARVSLALLAVGAPPDLVSGAHAAAIDETRHAAAMYALASEWGGVTVGPHGLDLAGMTLSMPTIEAIAEEAFLEGCIGEVAAALVLREEAERARDASTRDTLTSMADDEERHAELAWRTIAWALLRSPVSVRAVLEKQRALIHLEITKLVTEKTPHVGVGASITSSTEREAIRARALRGIVAPCLDALLA